MSYLACIYSEKRVRIIRKSRWLWTGLTYYVSSFLLSNVSIDLVVKFFVILEIHMIKGHGAPRFANYSQDHMVLQRAPQRAIVWGFGEASKLTTLTINDHSYQTMSNSEVANEQGESNLVSNTRSCFC